MHVRHQHLAEEERLPFRERPVHPQVTGLDPASEEAGREARDLQRVVVVLRLARHLAGGGDHAVALELGELGGVEAGGGGQLGAGVVRAGSRPSGSGRAWRRVVDGVVEREGRRERGRARRTHRRPLGRGRVGHGGRCRVDGLGSSGGGRPGIEQGFVARGELVEAFLDHLEREEVLLLLVQDPPEPGEVVRIELAVPRRRAFRVDQPLALEEPDLRDRDVGELVAQLGEHLADREVLGLPRAHWSPLPTRKTRTNRPIWRSARWCSGAVSTRLWST